MLPIASHVAGRAKLQTPCSTSYTVLPSHRTISRGLTHLNAVSDNGNGKAHAKQVLKFYFFDPANPEEVREMEATHHEQHSHHHHSNNGNGHGHSSSGNGHHASNGYSASPHANSHNKGTQLAHVKDSSKDFVQLQRLATQLEETRSIVVKLQQYEMMYKETRIRSKQMQAEVATLQQLLADKDAELARQYKRMETEASERSGLRSQFNSAIDEVKELRNELEEARQAMVELRGAIPAAVGSRRGGSRSSGLLDDGSPAAGSGSGSSPDVLSSLQGLAKQLAEGMEQEVGSLFGGSARREA